MTPPLLMSLSVVLVMFTPCRVHLCLACSISLCSCLPNLSVSAVVLITCQHLLFFLQMAFSGFCRGVPVSFNSRPTQCYITPPAAGVTYESSAESQKLDQIFCLIQQQHANTQRRTFVCQKMCRKRVLVHSRAISGNHGGDHTRL